MAVVDQLVQDYTTKTHERINDLLVESQPHSFTAPSIVSESVSIQKATTELQKQATFCGDKAETQIDKDFDVGERKLDSF